MGWTNFIVIPKFKILVEVSRHVKDVDEDFNIKIYEEIDFDFEKPIKDFTINDMAELVNFYNKSTKLNDNNELLLYWLKSRDIDYEVITEFEYDKKKNKYGGWNILRMF